MPAGDAKHFRDGSFNVLENKARRREFMLSSTDEKKIYATKRRGRRYLRDKPVKLSSPVNHFTYYSREIKGNSSCRTICGILLANFSIF